MALNNDDEPKNSHEKWWKVPLEFATHVIAGTAIFFLVAIPSLLISMTIHWLESTKHLSPLIIGVFSHVEYTIVFVDLCLFLIFIFKKALIAAKKL